MLRNRSPCFSGPPTKFTNCFSCHTEGDGESMTLETQRRVRAVRVASLRAIVDRRKDGVIYVRSLQPLGKYPARVTDQLEFWAAEAPERVFLAQRNRSGAWKTATYAETLTRVRTIASGLLKHGLSSSRPLLILSGNGIE